MYLIINTTIVQIFFFILGITKSAGGRFSFHPFNHIRITPGTSSNNNTPTKSDLSTAGSENNVIEGIKTVESNGVTALGAINTASISKPRKLVHSKSTGNLFSGKMKRIKEALRLIITIVFSFTQISLIKLSKLSKFYQLIKIELHFTLYLALEAIVGYNIDS